MYKVSAQTRSTGCRTVPEVGSRREGTRCCSYEFGLKFLSCDTYSLCLPRLPLRCTSEGAEYLVRSCLPNPTSHQRNCKAPTRCRYQPQISLMRTATLECGAFETLRGTPRKYIICTSSLVVTPFLLTMLSPFSLHLGSFEIFGGVLICTIIYAFFNFLWPTSPAFPLPPGPKPLPFIGNVLDVPLTRQWLVYSQWAERYGTWPVLCFQG